mmetsp:Transcript_57179/g.158320  ORF Transcript_57179/g.158320 Transcript_57179/m.158320 type:complete len:322 (+) Transcript_57179:102-1067(+)
MLTAGFPCQPFSALGEQKGLSESRGRLFLHICRILRARQPPLVLLENVPGLLETDAGQAFETVLTEVRASGYRVAYRMYNSQCVLPQKRKRVYIVAIRADLEDACNNFRFPWLPELNRSVSEILEETLHPEEAASLVVSEHRWAKIQASLAFQEAPEDVLGPLDQPAAPLVSTYGEGCGRYARYTQLVPGRAQPGGTRGPPRRFSRREVARLQGFPEGFALGAGGPRAWYRLAGNAVGPPMVCALAGALLCALEHDVSGCLGPALGGVAPALRLALAAAPAAARTTLLARLIRGPGGWVELPLADLLACLEGGGGVAGAAG